MHVLWLCRKLVRHNPLRWLPSLHCLTKKVEEICEAISKEGEVVVAANYNCPGQIVISGSIEGINKACEQMKAAGAKRALPLKVGGAFPSADEPRQSGTGSCYQRY